MDDKRTTRPDNGTVPTTPEPEGEATDDRATETPRSAGPGAEGSGAVQAATPAVQPASQAVQPASQAVQPASQAVQPASQADESAGPAGEADGPVEYPGPADQPASPAAGPSRPGDPGRPGGPGAKPPTRADVLLPAPGVGIRRDLFSRPDRPRDQKPTDDTTVALDTGDLAGPGRSQSEDTTVALDLAGLPGAGVSGAGVSAPSEETTVALDATRLPRDSDARHGPADGEPADDGPADDQPAAPEDRAEDRVGDGDEPAGGTVPRPRWWSMSRAAMLIGVLCGLLGFGLAVQVKSNTASNGLSAARQEDLVRILDDLSSREERLRRQISSLEAARTRLTTTGDKNSAALVEARSRSAALGVLAGTVPAAGPGIQLTMTDPQHRLKAEDLLDAVEELRAAGAEAIQVGPVRIGLDSAFTDSDGTTGTSGILADNQQLSPPYVIQAIGDPATLATALNIPGGVVDTVRQAGGRAAIDQQQRLVIRALRSLSTPHYAQPAE